MYEVSRSFCLRRLERVDDDHSVTVDDYEYLPSLSHREEERRHLTSRFRIGREEPSTPQLFLWTRQALPHVYVVTKKRNFRVMLRCRIWRNVVSADDYCTEVLYRSIVPKYLPSSSCAKKALQSKTPHKTKYGMRCDVPGEASGFSILILTKSLRVEVSLLKV
jgi:hypothetical protein